jgi:hypothetical protein
MRGDHRDPRQFEHLVEGRIADVGDVDHDALPVHLGHHLAAEGAEPVPLAVRVIGRIRDVVAERVRQRDVADAPVAEKRQVLQLALDG